MLLLTISEFVQPIIVYSQTIYNKYAKTTVNIRSSPNTESQICGQFFWNDKVNVLLRQNKKWYKILYHGKIRYVAAKYLRNSKCKPKIYQSPGANSFKSYEDSDCITNNVRLSQGRLKQKYHMDYQTGVWMVGDRYCVALGQYYTQKVGIKIDLVLSDDTGTHVLKCVAADVKAKKDTIDNKIHKDGSIAEFVVKTSLLSKRTRFTGNISYAGKQFSGKIVKIRVYEEE